MKSRFEAVQRILIEEYPYSFKGKDIRRVLEQLPVPRDLVERRKQIRLIAQAVVAPFQLASA